MTEDIFLKDQKDQYKEELRQANEMYKWIDDLLNINNK